MDNVSVMKTEVRTGRWLEIVRRCQESGLTVRSWCEANGVKVKSYYYWLRKFRTQLCDQLKDSEVNHSSGPVCIGSTPVCVGSVPSVARAAVTVRLDGQTLTVEIADGTSEETIGAVIGKLLTHTYHAERNS